MKRRDAILIALLTIFILSVHGTSYLPGSSQGAGLWIFQEADAESRQISDASTPARPPDLSTPPRPEDLSTPPKPGIEIKNPLKYDTLECILRAIAGFLFNISIPIVTIMVLLAGYQILTAAGNTDKVATGKRTLMYAVAGFVVILVAGSIADLVANIIGAGKLPEEACPGLFGGSGSSGGGGAPSPPDVPLR